CPHTPWSGHGDTQELRRFLGQFQRMPGAAAMLERVAFLPAADPGVPAYRHLLGQEGFVSSLVHYPAPQRKRIAWAITAATQFAHWWMKPRWQPHWLSRIRLTRQLWLRCASENRSPYPASLFEWNPTP